MREYVCCLNAETDPSRTLCITTGSQGGDALFGRPAFPDMGWAVDRRDRSYRAYVRQTEHGHSDAPAGQSGKDSVNRVMRRVSLVRRLGCAGTTVKGAPCLPRRP